MIIETIVDEPRNPKRTIILAHGAGAGMRTEFMEFFAHGLAENGYRVIRFEFPYMTLQQRLGRRRPPDREPVLRDTWCEVIRQFAPDRAVIGGKSMGGRIATLVADEMSIAATVCLGYPFHPSGKPDRLRIDHLRTLRTPTLIVQGERDPLGNRSEVESLNLSPAIQIHWLADGDHGFKPRKASGRTVAENWREAIETVARFVASIDDGTVR